MKLLKKDREKNNKKETKRKGISRVHELRYSQNLPLLKYVGFMTELLQS